MNLAPYQNDVVKRLVDRFSSTENECSVIKLTGCIGSGKTTIALGLIDALSTDWCSFYISGISPSLDPYMTWHIGTKLFSKSKLSVEGDISFGIDIPLISLSSSFSLNRIELEKTDYLFTANEEILIAYIKKKMKSKKRILIIADDFAQWDLPSVRFLYKLSLPQIETFNNCTIGILLVSHQNESSPLEFCQYTLDIPQISDDDITHILHQNGFARLIDLNELKLCAGNDLSLMLMAATHLQESSKLSDMDFSTIMDRRYNALSEMDRQALNVLESLSILDEPFSHNETAFFLNEPVSSDTLERADECLFLASQQDFISGEEHFRFSNSKLKQYFRSKLSRREKYHHRKYADYLQKTTPEKYYSRGMHTKMGMLSSRDRLAYTACQLLLLAYSRRVLECEKEDDVNNVLLEIDDILFYLPDEQSRLLKRLINNVIQGTVAFYRYDYSQAIILLQGIDLAALIPSCRAECLRLILLCHIQLANNPIEVREIASELYDLINLSNFIEDEQYCRAALVLLDVYLDRSVSDSERARILKQKLIQIINIHLDSDTYLDINACFNRKAALYYPAIIAAQQTFESVCYYQEHFNNTALYMALCNWCANSLIAGQFEDALNALNQVKKLMQENTNCRFPSAYKIRNNEILLDYLLSEADADDDSSILQNSSKALHALECIADQNGEEVSHVILLNRLAFALLCSAPMCQAELENARQLVVDTDDYYRFFLLDLLFASAVVHEEFSDAYKILCEQDELDVPLLYPYSPIFKARRRIQLQLCMTPNSHLNIVDYNELIMSECKHIQDPSCTFYGRGLLLSDLQFLSI